MSAESSPAKSGHDRKQAVERVLEVMARTWPKTFTEEARADDVEIWGMALSSIPVDLLLPAAKRYIANEAGRYAPRSREFADYARELARKHTEATAPVVGWHPKSFWYETDGYDVEGKPAIVRKTATQVPCGGYAGISEPEMDALYAGVRPWGWL